MKRFYLAIIAVVFAVGSAFTLRPDPTWYFTGDSTSPTERTTPSKYNTTVLSCSSSQNRLCSIIAPDNSGVPSISGQLQTDLNNSNGSAPNYGNTDIKGRN